MSTFLFAVPKLILTAGKINLLYIKRRTWQPKDMLMSLFMKTEMFSLTNHTLTDA